MSSASAALVNIVRDFLAADQLIRHTVARYRRGELRFSELEELIGDDENAILYRIKEHSHALFRGGPEGPRVAMRREALFDLAVGSLFHEAMSLRENYYQLEVYAPRVRALRSEAGDEAEGLFGEFEKIMASVSERLEEGLRETGVLLAQTRAQLRELLTEHRADGHLARFLAENGELVEEVFGDSLDELLAGIHGDAARGFALVGRSYLTSGYFDDAAAAFARALELGSSDASLPSLSAYARGMGAFLVGDYATSVEQLGVWVRAGGSRDADLLGIARAALSRVGQLVEGAEGTRVGAAAAALTAQLAGGAEGAREAALS